MPCPFGFTADDADDDEDVSSEEGEQSEDREEQTKALRKDAEERSQRAPAKEKSPPEGVVGKKQKKKVRLEFALSDLVSRDKTKSKPSVPLCR
jgi:hypothetical protein